MAFKKYTEGYQLTKLQEKSIICLRKMKKNCKQAVKIYNEGIGVEISIEKCAVLVMRSVKRQMTGGL